MNPKIWIITDTHFGHDKLIEYGRPIDFNDRILNSFSMIKPGDMLIHLGDFCIGNDETWHKVYFKELTGVKNILVRGNHDHKSNSWYLAAGWDMVCESFTFDMFGKKIMFSHYPKAWDGYFDVNIHGHFHDTDHRRFEPQFTKLLTAYNKLLAIERTDYQPVSLEKFISK